MSLYLKYRPQNFTELVSNQSTVDAITNMLSKPNPPHTYLLQGPTGCGKTTIARIMATMLGCVGNDYREVDSADFRGIDTIREIRKQAQFKPLEGKCRVWVIDECFVKGSLVTLANGTSKPIESVEKGDYIHNLYGKDVVTSIFTNRIPINRLMKITFSNGKEILCSDNHLFMTINGWIKAKNLKNNFVFLNIFSTFAKNISSLNLTENEKRNELPILWQKINKKTKKILQSSLQQQGKAESSSTNGNSSMPYLWCKIYSQMFQPKSNLFEYMWKQISRFTSSWTNYKFRNSKKIIKRSEKLSIYNSGRIEAKENFIGTNEVEQPINKPKSCIKNENHQKNKRFFTYLERGTWWKWKTDTTAVNVSDGVGLEDRDSNKNRAFTIRWFKLPYQLQSRYWKQRFKNSNRSRWNGTQWEKSKIIGQEKNGEIARIRVESVEIYQQGYNDGTFNGIIGDTERSQGYVTLYDLEVSNHHSYIVNDILVHNCHKSTPDAQNALLKILEDTPEHVFFILCTTEPEKLIKTVRGRCSIFTVNLLSDKEMFRLLRRITTQEGETLEKEIYDQIIQDSLGHPRNAIQTLEQVLNVEPELRMNVAQKKAEEYNEAIELCRALINGSSWKKVASILAGIKANNQEHETVRRVVLGYCQAILLKGAENDKAGRIMEEMIEPFYNSGFPQLTYACYSICRF